MSLFEKEEKPDALDLASLKNFPAGARDVMAGNVRNPHLEMTYEHLLNEYIKGKNESTWRSRTWAVNKWLAHQGLSLSAVAGNELLSEFDTRLTSLRNEMAGSSKTSANLASDLRGLRALFVCIRQASDIPIDLHNAIQFGLTQTGKKLSEFSVSTSPTYHQIYEYAKGIATPYQTSQNEDLLAKLNAFLGFPDGTLASRAWPHRKHHIIDLSQSVPYRTYSSIVTKHKYAFEKEEWTEQLKLDLSKLIEHKKKDVFVIGKKVFPIKPSFRWNSQDTVNIYSHTLECFFGYLTLPKSTQPVSSLTWEEKLDFGLGIDKKSLTILTVLNTDYLMSYFNYCMNRSFNEEHFKDCQKNVTKNTHRQTASKFFNLFIRLIKSFVNKPTSFFRVHDELSLQSDVPLSDWQEFLDEKNDQLKNIIEYFDQNISTGKRSNKRILQPILRDANIYTILHELLNVMREDFPTATKEAAYYAHSRNVAIVSFLLFDPLRSRNICGLEYKNHIIEIDGRLWLDIKSWEFKNGITGHAEDRLRQLSKRAEQDMQKWLAVRVKMLKKYESSSNLVFTLVCRVNIEKSNKLDPYSISTNHLYSLLSSYTKKYLGIGIGPHSFRLLLGTAVGKKGTPQQVKAILNDSEEVAMKFYNDARNSDQFTSLNELLGDDEE